MLRSLAQKRLPLLYVACVSIILGVGSAAITRIATRPSRGPTVEPEARPLLKKYGPMHNSYGAEEWIVRDFFGDKREGFFVDVGANHYKITSNTYYLETSLNWSGIAVEPQKEFQADYAKFRPRTRYFPFFISDTSNERAKLYVLENSTQTSSGDKTFTEQPGKKVQELAVPTITLTDLLDSERVQRVDYMSIDIELWEPKALAGFDIDRFQPKLVCIEAHLQVRQQLLEYFAQHHYMLIGKYLRADVNNLYFTPES
jgi:FkbM family methyltransferase